MAKNLVIVESPSKSKTIEKYLGKDYKVLSSKGHVRDLSTRGKFGLGVDIENNFTPDYTTISKQKKIVDELKKEVQKVEHVYLATDPDREGEAISWHLYDVLGLKEKDYDRVVFNEITKNAVIDAFHHVRKIDKNLVNSQETRRILDRIIGFRLSKLMQQKTDGTSAGRVQSVALKLIVDKEREIEKFISEEYWTITAIFKGFEAELFQYKNKDITIKNEAEAQKIVDTLNKNFLIKTIDKKEKKKKAKMPFTTSTLQIDASNKLGFPAKKTMSIAQKLYEGISLADETVGLITYMRTDSTRISNEFVKETYSYIETNYGKKYVGSVRQGKKRENVQDAHEAIRPTSIERNPLAVKPFLTNDEYKLYRLIYFRALASLMSDAITENTTVELENNDYLFKATGQIVTFDGYLKVYQDYEETSEVVLPPLDDYKESGIASETIEKEQHFTKPPARYTEARLIDEMEKLGIGRPSTYAKTMDTIKSRGYATLVDKKFVPTDIGIEITDKLQEHFAHLINVKYTAAMESKLDEIAEGKIVWYNTLKEFYNDFAPALEKAFEAMPKKEALPTGEDCPICGHPLVIRKGKYGEFTACSNYPKCKYIKPSKAEEVVVACPNCDGEIVIKHSRRGKLFYGCNNYPKCKTAFWDRPTGEKCPNCGSMLVEKNKSIKCSSCDYTKE